MKRLIFVFVLLSLLACSGPVAEPPHLVDKKTMSKMIAELALADQMGMLNQNGSVETESRYILKKYGVAGKQFKDSYSYYTASPKILDQILSDAQEIIVKMDPEAEAYIKKKTVVRPGIMEQ